MDERIKRVQHITDNLHTARETYLESLKVVEGFSESEVNTTSTLMDAILFHFAKTYDHVVDKRFIAALKGIAFILDVCLKTPLKKGEK